MQKNIPVQTKPHWKDVLNATDDLIFIKDKDAKVVDANQAFFNLYNAPADEIVGQTTFESYPKEEQDHFIKKDQDAFILGYARSDIQLTSEKSGEQYYYDMQKTRFEFEGEVYLLCSGRNITETKKYTLVMEEIAKITSSSGTTAEKLEKLLALGNEYLGTDHGVISHVFRDDYSAVYVSSKVIPQGAVFPLENTFCDVTIANERLTHAFDTEQSMFANHPCLEAFKLGAYIGIPIYCGESLYGTLNFSAVEKRKKDFSKEELKFFLLLRERVSFYINEIQRLKELNRSQEVFRQALEGAAHGMAIVDLDGGWLKVNKSLCQILGYSEEELMGMDFQTVTYKDDLSIDNKLLNDCITGKKNKYTLEKRYIKKGGELVWGLLSVAIVRDENGAPQFFISQIQDINARHQYETQMIEMSAQLQAILDTAEDGIVTVDGYGEICSFNKAAEKMFGYKAAEAVGKNVSSMLIPQDAKSLSDRMDAYFETSERDIMRSATGVQGLGKDKRQIPIEVTISEIYNHGRENARYSAILRDVSLRIEHEKNLERYNQELKRSNEELENFARVASHDLREPLRGIYNFSQFMKEDYEDVIDDAGMNRLDSIMQMTKRMEGILSGLFDYAKIGRMEEAVTPLCLNELLGNIKLDIQRFLIDKNAEVEFDGLPTIMSYSVLMDMVLRNLITNGLKYNDSEKPKVTIEHSEEVGVHLITVKDNGIGIPEEFLDTIFQPFKRLQSRDSEFGEGSGMGLAFVQKAVANMGGYVKVSSAVGEGTTFTLCLPQTPIGGDGAENVCWLGAPK